MTHRGYGQFGTWTVRYRQFGTDNSVRDNSVRGQLGTRQFGTWTIRYADNSVRGQLGTRTIRYVVYCIALKFFRGGEFGILGTKRTLLYSVHTVPSSN